MSSRGIWGSTEKHFFFDILEVEVEPGNDSTKRGILLDVKVVGGREVYIFFFHG